jgi:putative Mg2+ transporter-C (MgtC) family protein
MLTPEEFQFLGVFACRVLIALALGMVIGIERQLGQHPAGVRTNALVCLGSALFVSLSSLLPDPEKSRIAAQVVSGIGFIGGGAILREGVTVRGMNTAATLWCSAAVGTLVGLGYWDLGVFGTVAVVGAHFVFRPVAHAIDNYTQGKAEMELLYEVKLICQHMAEEKIRAMLVEQIRTAKLRLQGLSMQDTSNPEHVEMKVSLYALQHNEQAMNDLVAKLACQAEVFRVSWGKAQ